MTRSFFILILGTFIIAALLAPVTMSVVAIIAPHLKWPFSRVYGRIAQIAAVGLIIYLRKDFNLPALKKHFKGNWAKKFGLLLLGLALTSISIGLVIPLLVNDGVLIYSGPVRSDLFRMVSEILFAMFFVSILEESFFRVLLFSSLKSRLSPIFAAVVTSCVYAFVHFISPVKNFTYGSFDIFAGFSYLSEVLTRFTQADVYPAILGLFLVGMILCYAIHRTGSLFLCVGLHMGWATGLKIMKYITAYPGGNEFPSELGGRYFLVAQPETWLSMLIVLILLGIFIEKRSSAFVA
jgi:membrane protease YdiL (CAAX protease family)